MALEQILWVALIAWLVLADWLLLRQRVFSPAKLEAAPTRQSKLSLPVVGGVIVAFFFVQVAVVLTAVALGIVSPREVGLPAASQPATATAVALSPEITLMEPPPRTQPQGLHPLVRNSILLALVYLFTAIPVLIWVPTLFTARLAGWGLHPRQIPRGILLGLFAFLMVFPIVQFFGLDLNLLYSIFFHREMSEHQTFQILDQHVLTRPQQLFLYFSALIIAPLAEELFFRGIVQTTLIQRGWGLLVPQLLGPSVTGSAYHPTAGHRWVAIVVTSLAFGAVHSLDQAPVIFVLSLGLGCVYERTGNLWASMTLHAAFNSAQVGLYLLGAGG